GLLLLQFLFMLGLVLGLSSLNVHFRDMQHIVANVLTFVFFLCPILYPADIVPEAFKVTLTSNPFALFTMSYQDLILHGNIPPLHITLLMVSFTGISLVFGNWLYNRYRESFAEAL